MQWQGKHSTIKSVIATLMKCNFGMVKFISIRKGHCIRVYHILFSSLPNSTFPALIILLETLNPDSRAGNDKTFPFQPLTSNFAWINNWNTTITSC